MKIPDGPRPKPKILVVEDDINLQKSISFILWKEGYQVLCADTGEEAIGLVRREKPDLILLDVLLPGIDGDKVGQILRRDPATADALIIMVSAKKKTEDIVEGLRTCADDYITKPFEPEILLARVQAVLRRKKTTEEMVRATLEYDGLVIDREAHEVLCAGKKLPLSKTEFDVLVLLAGKPNQVFTRARILDQVREDGYPITDRVVDYHITGLRKKLGPARKLIRTVRGVGYKFDSGDSH